MRRLGLALLLACAAVSAQAQAESAARPRIGLVLSGGGARGGAHIGVLKVLEELRVPIDVIAGTSAGSIVGAAYATGMPLADIEAEMKQLSTAVLFRDVDRAGVPMRLKADDATNFIGPEVGLGQQGLALPKGAVAGVALEAVLRRLTLRQNDEDFDRLPIRFRAVATDVTSAEPVILRRGSLASAIRASMALPAVVNPVEIDGRLLIDGGVSRNLPVDVARAMGADVIIAVNIGTPLLQREQITSLLSVSQQMTGFLVANNVRQSLAELGERDVLVAPDLGSVTVTDFDHLAEAAAAGERAARAMAPQLARYGVDPARYAALMAARSAVLAAAPPRIDAVRIDGLGRVNEEVVRAAMDSRAGRPFDAKTADEDMRRIYARGDFEHVSYYRSQEPGGREVLTVDASEKSWGPNYLRFGLALSSDFAGDSYFELLATHRRSWLNPLGGEWRNDLQIGHLDRVASEWYQPLSARQRSFVALRGWAAREPFDVYNGDARLASYRRQTIAGELGTGVPIGTLGELRLGAMRGRVKLLTDTSVVSGSDIEPGADVGGYTLRLRLDALDSLRFPRQGWSSDLSVYSAQRALGAEQEYDKFALALRAAWSIGAHTLRLAGEAAGGLGRRGDLPVYELVSLGGFQQLSGYKTGQFLGREKRFARVVYNYRISGPGFLDGVHLGASLEAGRIGSQVRGIDAAGTRYGSSIYLAADTPLGPVYLALGRASRHEQAIYFFLGTP